MSKLAVLQMSDTPQIESTAIMLRAAGYSDIMVCGPRLRAELTNIGCDTVLSVERMLALGYDPLDSSIGYADLEHVERCDLFVEIKVRNVPKIVNHWPRLKDKIAWWRVNGAQPEICPRGGDEVNLPCPVITACLWYGLKRYYQDEKTRPMQQEQSIHEHSAGRAVTLDELRCLSASAESGMNGMAYTFWPPWPRKEEYDRIDRSSLTKYEPPYSLAHNVYAWGFGEIVDAVRQEHGIRVYGNGCPDGQISHSEVPRIAATALALVHLKSVDCPGWALYEAILAGCPVVFPRLANSRMLAYDLFRHGETCLEYGVPASLEYGRGDPNLPKCIEDIRDGLNLLKNPRENFRIGEAGRRRLNELMWNEERDGDSFREFMGRWF